MKIWVRFILYATIGLLFFCVYFALVLPTILHALMPNGPWQTVYVVQGTQDLSATLLFIVAFLFCFVSAGALFSLFLVLPVSQLITTIRNIDVKDQKTKFPRPSQKPHGGKIAKFLFHDVFNTVENLKHRLELAEKERAVTEEAKRAWLAGVSHDLKTPLSYITGYSSLLLSPEHSFDKDEQLHHLTKIYEKGQQINELIDDLNLSFMLDNGTPLPVKRERENLVDLIRNAVAVFTDDKRWEAYRFIFTDPNQSLFICLDKKLMTRAISNLIQNCIDHNPPGTTVCLFCDKTDDEIIFITIDDDGHGMDSVTLHNCLKKHYSSSDDAYPGKGLGLSIVKSIITAHEAELTVDSKEGQGTHVRILFDRNYVV